MNHVNSDFIKAKMKIKGLRQIDLALEWGYTENTTNSKINGRSEMTVSDVFRLCEILECSYTDILC